MGCLLEFLLEVLVEGLLELIGYCYIQLMQLIVPHKSVSEKMQNRIRNIVKIVAAILAIVLIISGIIWLAGDGYVERVGKILTLGMLGIIAAQIILGIVMRIVGHFKK